MSQHVEQAISQIRAAFSDDARPANEALLHKRCFDDADLEPLYDIGHWTQMPDDVVINEYAALSFLSAAGFRHFLPAYLTWTLRHPDSGQAAVDSTVWALHPRMYSADLREFAESKYALLDARHRDAVLSFLEAMAEAGHPDAAAATEWWREVAGTA